MKNKKVAIIIGAGPAGLTAAYELLKRTDIKPVILEMSGDIGGISKTVNYKGNRMDIGGHRFFSKSDRVMNWWQNILSIEEIERPIKISYQNKNREVFPDTGANKNRDMVMLVRERLSRIYFERKLFNYPLTLALDSISKLGFFRLCHIIGSYLHARLFFTKKEVSLEDFFIKRFGKVLYQTFFKDYTEKVWGKACHEIDAEWGHQRIKKLSITTTILHALQKLFKKKATTDLAQKDTETSLIERFLYPKYGPGQLWEEVAKRIQEMGGEIHMNQQVCQIKIADAVVKNIVSLNDTTMAVNTYEGDYFFSTMPVKELVTAIDGIVPGNVQDIAAGLEYRDFITVGLLVDKLVLENKQTSIKDNWIYIQENDVKIGRLQIFNNWSPAMVQDPNTIWLGLEYFCNEGDELWKMSDPDFTTFAIDELQKIGIILREDVRDSTLVRMKKTYPAYFGTYKRFGEIKTFMNTISNLFLIGRNGMHKYNNADHSMLTAMTAVDNIIAGYTGKENIWEINTEQEYHETKQST